jgi:hypothetical protein
MSQRSLCVGLVDLYVEVVSVSVVSYVEFQMFGIVFYLRPRP